MQRKELGDCNIHPGGHLVPKEIKRKGMHFAHPLIGISGCQYFNFELTDFFLFLMGGHF